MCVCVCVCVCVFVCVRLWGGACLEVDMASELAMSSLEHRDARLQRGLALQHCRQLPL